MVDPGAELDNNDVKEYFSKTNTVSKWWDPEEKPGLFRDLYVKQRQLLGELLDTKGKIILDAGTGKGRFAIDFALGGAGKVYATDISEEMLTIARQRAAGRSVENDIEFQPMDIESMKYADGFFDIACCMETFVHLPSPQTAMNELARVVKPGGLVVGSVTLPIKNWYLNVRRVSNLDQLYEWLFTPIYQSKAYQSGLRRVLRRPPLVGRPLRAEFFRSLFANSRLSIQKEVYFGYPRAPHFMLIVAKK